MNQSSIIAFFLIGGFIVYITVKGQLPQYAAVLGLGSSAANSGSLANLAPLAGLN